MSTYRYSTIDVIVGIGMCAIIFGAGLFFLTANGIVETAAPQPLPMEQPGALDLGMAWLQPALGRTIVEQAIFEREAHRLMAQSAAEWNRATLALQSLPDDPFETVRRQAVTGPADHMARVQGIMGRAIVNATQRGIRSGALSADLHLSDYNTRMIRAIEARGQALDREFAATWQATLGRSIVEAIQNYRIQAAAIQERLGRALVQVTQAHIGSQAVQGMQQEQLASLVVAAVRTEALADRLASLAAVEPFPQVTVGFTAPASWPEIPMGYMMAAGLVLAGIFFAGVVLADRARETKAQAEKNQDAARWVYRMAA